MENTNQFLNLTPAEMLALWRQLLHLDPVRNGAVITRTDGIDADSLLATHARQWYAHTLATAPAQLLPVEDVAAQVTLSTAGSGVVVAELPQQAVRPVEWQLEAWSHPVTEFLDPGSPMAQRQLNPYTRCAAAHPAIVRHVGHLVLYSQPAGSQPRLLAARCVVRPADGHYRFHAQLLGTIPQWAASRPGLL